MFLQWALDSGLMNSKATDALEYVKELGRGYVLQSDFINESSFANKYLMNLSGHDVLYSRDFAHSFLSGDLQERYTSAAAIAELDKLQFSENNYMLVKAMIDQRFKEFKEHGFKKSAALAQG